jgi:PAS domain S-box-containing protein
MFKSNINSESNLVDVTPSALLEAFPDAAYLIDLGGVIFNVNTVFASQIGKQPQDFIGTNIYDLITTVLQLPELAVYHRERCEEVLKSGKRVVFADERDVRKVAISPVLSNAGEISALLVTIQNIAEQKRVDRELQKERALKTALLDAIPCSALILDANFNIIVCNKYAQEMLFSTPAPGLPSVQVKEFFSPDEMGFLKERLMETINSGGEDAREIKVYPCGSAEPIWLLTRTSRIFIDGQPCAVSIGVDITERKRMEDELLESKRRFQYALDAAQAGIWEWNAKTDQLSWSEQVWGLYGLEVNSVTLNNQLCVDTIHPDDREMASWIIRDALSKGVAVSLEYRTAHPDGSVHWLTSRAMPLYDADGHLERYIGTIIDITERKEIEIALTESRKKLSQALEAAHAGVWEWDLTTNKNTFSKEIWPLFGLQRSDQKRTFDIWKDSVHPDDRELAVTTVSSALKLNTELNVQYRVIHPDGSVHWLMARGKPVKNEKGETIRYIGTMIDITDQKNTEHELTVSKKRLTFALEATNTGVWEWDVNTDNVIWTDNVWGLYGMEQNSSLPHTHKLCESNIYPEDRDLTFEKVMAAASKEMAINVEYRVKHKDDSIHWLMCHGVPSYNADGQFNSYIGTVTDITSRKEVLNNLLDSKIKLKQALKAARAGIWEWNLKTGENTWSDETWLLYGLAQGNLKPSFELWSSTIHPDDRDMAIETVSRATENKIELYIEYRISYHNGSIHWLLSRGKPIYDRDGNVERYIGTIIDITERKEIEEQRRRSQERLNFILENSHIGVWDLNLQNGTTARTLEHAHIFGYKTIPPVWSLETFFEHIIAEDRPRIQAFVRSEIEKKESYVFECRIYTAKGDLRWIRVTGTFKVDKQSNTSHVLGIIQDITDQKMVQASLRESELKFRTVFDYSPVAISIRDAHNGKILDVNDSWQQIFGYTKEEAAGRSIKELGLYIQNEDYEKSVATFDQQGKILNKPFLFRKKNGEIIQVLFSGKRIILEGKERILAMITDITFQELQQLSIERLEQIVAERTDQLNGEVERLRQFINMISHEYRTPLAIIRGNLDLLNLKINSGMSLTRVEMNKINRAIDRLVDVMEVSIDECRVFESLTTSESVRFRIAPVIVSQIEAFIAMWPERAILYSEHLDDGELSGDPSQLKLAIFNLLDNARKYSSEDSTIEMESRIEDREVVISIRNQASSFIGDEGDALFEKYRRGSNSMNTGGAGLGLWLVSNIVHQHNGRVSLTSLPSGVEATVRLPLVHGGE